LKSGALGLELSITAQRLGQETHQDSDEGAYTPLVVALPLLYL